MMLTLEQASTIVDAAFAEGRAPGPPAALRGGA